MDMVVKTEDSSEPGVKTVILQNIPQNVPIILKNLVEENDENFHLTQSGDVSYTYVIENAEDFEAGTEFEVADGEHYIIEEYQEEYDESQDEQYETVYIEHIEDGQEEVYTISEEINQQLNEQHTEEIARVDPLKVIIDDEETVQLSFPVEEQKPLAQNKQPEEPQETLTIINEHEDPEEILDAPEKKLKEAKEPEKATQDEADSSNSDKFDKDLALVFECSICGKGFKTPTGVKRHITISHWKEVDKFKQNKENDDVLSFSLCACCGEPSDTAHTFGDFKCDQCIKLFAHQNSLERHICIDHPVGEDYECNECKKLFKTRDCLIDHMRIHPIKSVKCEGCGQRFSRKYHLDRHVGQTGCMGVPKAMYECRVCCRTFARKDNLADHLKGHAGISNKKKRKFVCNYCKREFNGMALLNIHVRTHTGERPYACDICEKKFPSSGAMRKHRRMHTGEKPYNCPQCGNKFAAKETLNRHWRTHTGERPHQCKYCGKSFIQASQLRAHIFHHTGETAYTCPHCNRAFTRKLRLTTHIKFMHEGAEPLPCPQEGCNKTFFRKEDVQRHSLTHTGERPFECDTCHKAFAVKSSLRIHKLTHRKEPPVSCEVCSRAFIRQDCLMRHMRARHRDILEDILANAEKKRLQQQLLQAVSNASQKDAVKNTVVWNELTLTESIKDLLGLLVDEDCLEEFGYPDAPVDKVLDSVIRRCGHTPASELVYDYIGKLRENAKLLFTVVIDDQAVKDLLNNQTVDEVIMHVLKLAKKQMDEEEKFNIHKEEKVQDGDEKMDDEEYEVDDPDAGDEEGSGDDDDNDDDDK